MEQFSEYKILYYALWAMTIMNELHKNNLYYGDMKPDNILIFQNTQVKLGDFGTAIRM